MGNTLSLSTSANIVLGVIGAVVGLKNYASLPNDAVIPMQFGLDGAVGWSLQSKHAFLFYPVLSLFFGFIPKLLHSQPNLKINYPFNFDESKREDQRRLAIFYLSTLHLLLGGFFVGLSGHWIPNIVKGNASGIPASVVCGGLAAIGLLTA